MSAHGRIETYAHACRVLVCRSALELYELYNDSRIE